MSGQTGFTTRMHDMAAELNDATLAALDGCVRLSEASAGDAGQIVEVRADHGHDDHGVDVHELERRLLEFGFVEGARFEVLHEGPVWRDPLVLKLDAMRVALRRRDARDVWVRLDTGGRQAKPR